MRRAKRYQTQEEVRGLRPLKDERGFAQRCTEKLGRCLVKPNAAFQQLSTWNIELLARVDELLSAKQQFELALARARSSVTAQEQVVASMLERLTVTPAEPDLTSAKDAEASGWKGAKKPAEKGT